MILVMILFYYLAYYRFVIEVNQFLFYRGNYVENAFNWVDSIAIVLPVIHSFYFLFGYYRIDYGFKNATTTQASVFIIFMSIVFLWIGFFQFFRIWPTLNNYLTTIINIAISIRAFLIFNFLLIIAVGHALFILLGHPSYLSLSQVPDSYNIVHTNSNKIVYNMFGEEPNNPFANLLSSILAVYNWDSIPLDTWNFWPLIVINIIGGFFFVMILSNVIISFMSNAFEDTKKESKHSTRLYQKTVIYDYAVQNGSSLTSRINDFDLKFRDKLNVRYICFLDEPELTKAWNDKSDELGSRWLDVYGLHFKHEISDEDDIEKVKFIWTQEEHMC
ncbi:hypothetical protein C2G38_1213998 [Gigaspora rosea]|uniref:Ion transport domain-containing protein n=1 Tax=Gigaspora rosea TaxID=44941 RepID=A0A397VCM2_9GLOM|nr:hypothetical protein C2G38_1213998 [Gigaspora rosea]